MLQIPGLGPKTVKQIYEELGHRDARGPPPGSRGGHAQVAQGPLREDREPHPRRHRRARDPADAIAAQPGGGGNRGYRGRARERPRRAPDQPGRLVPPPSRDDRRPRPARRRRTTRSRLMERFTGLGARRGGRSDRGGHKAAVRLLRGPQVDLMVDAARRGGHVPHPLHRLEGAQRQAPGDRPRSRLEPVRERFPEDRRGRRAADRRRRRAADVRDGGRGLRASSTCRSSNRSSGRITARSRPPGRAGCPGSSPRPIFVATATPTRSGVTVRTPIETMAEACRRRGLRLPGPDRPLLLARDRPRPGPGAGGAAAHDHRRAERPVRARGARRAPRRPRRRPKASASSTAASSRSAQTGSSTTRTTCWRASTSSSHRSTSRAASRGPS